MNHQEASGLLNHFSALSIHRSLKRKEWQKLKIDWFEFLVNCENKYQRTKSKYKTAKTHKEFYNKILTK